MRANKEVNTKHIGIGGIKCPCCYDRKVKLNKTARKTLKHKLHKELADLYRRSN